MYANKKIQILLFLCLRSSSISSATEHATDITELNCDSFCSCDLKPINEFSNKFNIACKGTNIEKVKATSILFNGQKTPDMESQVYVILQNFSSLTINDDFISRWSAYESCSMDLWYNGQIHFPTVSPEKGASDAITFFFSGIGLAYSSISSFPLNFFKNRAKVHLKIINSTINHLDLGGTLGEEAGLTNFELRHSTVGQLKSSRPVQINASKKVFQITNSRIGVLDKGGLQFNDTGYRPSIAVEDSTIGLMMEGSIEIKKEVSLSISRCTIGYLPKFSIKLNKESHFKLTDSNINLFQESFSNFACNPNQRIASNNMYPLDFDKGCLVKNNSEKCIEVMVSKDYIEPSCGKNYLLSPIPFAPVPKEVTEDPKTDLYITIPVGILYLLIAVAASLLLMVFVLAGMLVCRKNSPQKNPKFPVNPHPFLEDSTPIYFSSKSHLGDSVLL